MDNDVEVSAIVPISERYDAIHELHAAYRDALERTGRSYEFIYVLDGEFADAFEELSRICQAEKNVRVLKFARWFGEATALTAGIENATGDIVLTLPAYLQVEPSEIPKFLEALDDNDMIVARRSPRADPGINRLQSRVFHWFIRLAGGSDFADLGCSVRAVKRRVFDEVPIYGDQHRFLPVLTNRYGFRVKEVPVAQAAADRFRRVYPVGVYIRRMLDILTVFFLIKFTKKPLRFFGLIGVATAVCGGLILAYVVVERTLFQVALSDRPALLLSSLLVVLGVQLFALGLLGELIIFVHARGIKEYTVEEVVSFTAAEDASVELEGASQRVSAQK